MSREDALALASPALVPGRYHVPGISMRGKPDICLAAVEAGIYYRLRVHTLICIVTEHFSLPCTQDMCHLSYAWSDG